MTRVSQCLGMLGAVCALSATCLAQTVLPPQGSEFNPVGKMIGDQVHPSLALSSAGGYLVWEDNATESGYAGIKGVPVATAGLAKGATSFLSEGLVGDNQNPQVALLNNGGKIVVWQGGNVGFQKIYARIVGADNALASSAFRVNTYTNNEQINPVVRVLKDGNIFVAWTSVGQDGDKGGVFARRLSPAGEFLGDEFQISQTSANNQRNIALAVLTNGNLVATWVSEKLAGEKVPPYVKLFGRFFKPAGVPVGDEFMIATASTNDVVCANPQLAALPNGGFTVVWSQRALAESNNSWDVYSLSYNRYGAADATPILVNSYTYGDQYGPQIAASGTNQIVVWTSLLQDGDWEGVFGRILDGQGKLNSDEFRVNTITSSRQIHPMVADSGTGNAVVAWAGFGTGENSFDICSQAYGKVAVVVPRLTLAFEDQVTYIKWTTQVGLVYQVQVSADLSFWENAGNPRTATGETDSVALMALDGAAYYRVVIMQ